MPITSLAGLVPVDVVPATSVATLAVSAVPYRVPVEAGKILTESPRPTSTSPAVSITTLVDVSFRPVMAVSRVV